MTIEELYADLQAYVAAKVAEMKADIFLDRQAMRRVDLTEFERVNMANYKGIQAVDHTLIRKLVRMYADGDTFTPMPLAEHLVPQQVYSANSDTYYSVLDPQFIQRDENGNYLKDNNYGGDGGIYGCPQDIDPVNIENEDGNFYFLCTTDTPFVYDTFYYEDFAALNRLKASGFVVLDSAYLQYLSQNNLPFTPYRPSLAEVVYDAETQITEVIVEDSDKNKWRRRFNHASQSMGAWAKDISSAAPSVAAELAATDAIYTPLLNSGADIYGYMNGQEGLLGLNPFGWGTNFSISTGGKAMSIQKSDGSYASVFSYSTASPFVKRVLLSKDITSLSAYKYALYGIDLSRFKKLTSLTLVTCRGFSGQKLPASLTSVYIESDSANDQSISEINLPNATSVALRSTSAGESIVVNAPLCTDFNLRSNLKLKYLTILSDMPNITKAIIDFGNNIELDGLSFLSKISSTPWLEATNMNLADKNGIHLVLPSMPNLKLLVMRNCALSQASVDSLISFMLDQAQSGRIPAAQINLALGRDDANSPYTGRVNATPSAAGLANVDTLRGLGAYVEHN